MATIKEIAKECGVSISTVSRIVNNKANDISQEVINRVLATVKKYNYSPYGTSKQNQNYKSMIIALLVQKFYNSGLIINGIVEELEKQGYSLMIFDCGGIIENERVNLNKILTKNIDGLIWEPFSKESVIENNDILSRMHSKTIYLSPDSSLPYSYILDFKAMSVLATETLIANKHTNIACIIKTGSINRSRETILGFKEACFNHQINLREDCIFTIEDFDFNRFNSYHFTGIVCSHFSVAQKMAHHLHNANMLIPDDISIISMRDDSREGANISGYSTILLPNYEFGCFLGRKIIEQCESKKTEVDKFVFTPYVESMDSISQPANLKEPAITVIGSISMDNILYLRNIPKFGFIQQIDNHYTNPGGRGLNQAIGCSKLGKSVSLIGGIGRDGEGVQLIKLLNENYVDTRYIVQQKDESTGKSFILINQNGDSSTVFVKGANYNLTQDKFKSFEHAFDNCGVCILSSEVNLEAINFVKRAAKKANATTIYKPSAIVNLNDDDYKDIDIIIPNRMDAANLSGRSNLLQAADFFHSKGIKTVIITLDKDGALLSDSGKQTFYPAFKVSVVDTTGGADAFVSAFSVMYLDGYDLESCVLASLAAASYCVSKVGVNNALVDLTTLKQRLKTNQIVMRKKNQNTELYI